MTITKKRHGCLTAYLIFMMIANTLAIVAYAGFGAAIQKANPGMPDWAMLVLPMFGVLNVVCAIGLFKLRKWGFWGFVISAAVVFFINIAIGLNILQALFGLVGIAIIYGVLQIGGENKGWTQLD